MENQSRDMTKAEAYSRLNQMLAAYPPSGRTEAQWRAINEAWSAADTASLLDQLRHGRRNG